MLKLTPYRRHQLFLLLGSILILAAGAVFKLSDDGIIRAPLLGFKLPETCMSHIVFDTDCPACGLTRSFVETAHGNLKQAVDYHRLGPLFFLLVIFQIPYRSRMLYKGETFKPAILTPKVIRGLGAAVIAALLINWFANLLFFW